VVAVPEAGDPPQWVLIDGYRRREVLQQLGADRIWADIWERSVDEALLACLARGDVVGICRTGRAPARLLREVSDMLLPWLTSPPSPWLGLVQ
jgi:hypothetical protein